MKWIKKLLVAIFGEQTVENWRKKIVAGGQNALPSKLERMRRRPGKYPDPNMWEAIDYVLEHGPTVFPYPYTEKYDPASVEVYTDADSGLKYVMYGERRLYMRRGSDDSSIRRCRNSLSIEQDPLSPHCYRTDGFEMAGGSILFDLGCAEGNFALSNIDTVSRVFLFEPDKAWLEPLAHTFAPWEDKVTIIDKAASDRDGEKTVTVDSVMREYDIQGPVFLKLDVEGAEMDVLKGARETLARDNVKAVVCTYHKRGDHATLSRFMKKAGYEVLTSRGYMLFIHSWKSFRPPYFRRGVIYCTKMR